MFKEEIREEEKRRESIRRYREGLEKRIKQLDNEILKIEKEYEKRVQKLAEYYDKIIERARREGNTSKVETLEKEGRFKLNSLKYEEKMRKKPILYQLKELQEKFFEVTKQEM